MVWRSLTSKTPIQTILALVPTSAFCVLAMLPEPMIQASRKAQIGPRGHKWYGPRGHMVGFVYLWDLALNLCWHVHFQWHPDSMLIRNNNSMKFDDCNRKISPIPSLYCITTSIGSMFLMAKARSFSSNLQLSGPKHGNPDSRFAKPVGEGYSDFGTKFTEVPT